MKKSSRLIKIFEGIAMIIIAVAVTFTPIFLDSAFRNGGIKKENAQTVDVEIVKLTDVNTKLDTADDGGLSSLYYVRGIGCSYTVNGIKYNKVLSYRSYNEEIVESFNVGDSITITYDTLNPNKVMIGTPNYGIGRYFGLIFMGIIFVVIGIVLIIDKDEEIKKIFPMLENKNEVKKRKNNKYALISSFIIMLLMIIHEYRTTKIYEQGLRYKSSFSTVILVFGIIMVIYYIYHYFMKVSKETEEVELKVLQVDVIDYERERVFFSNSENVYFYETDFGKDFKINEKYNVQLSLENQKSTRVEFQEQNIKAIQIVKIEKNEFKIIE